MSSPSPCKTCGEAWFLSYLSDGARKFCGVCNPPDMRRVKQRWTLVSGPSGEWVPVRIDTRKPTTIYGDPPPPFPKDGLPHPDILEKIDEYESGMSREDREAEVKQLIFELRGPKRIIPVTKDVTEDKTSKKATRMLF